MTNDALAEFKGRYASDQISEEEFERRPERLLAVNELLDVLFEFGSGREEADQELDLER
ncbi:hypothetical protein [Natronorubrum sp. A-ect3]|uniref:hypothetical protein n=1 Tax=Natronorubrum sp. A-ect3 TaxID=3242698 RepID=UPI00359EE96D